MSNTKRLHVITVGMRQRKVREVIGALENAIQEYGEDCELEAGDYDGAFSDVRIFRVASLSPEELELRAAEEAYRKAYDSAYKACHERATEALIGSAEVRRLAQAREAANAARRRKEVE